MLEVWKRIEGYENYEVSITGLVRKGNVILKPYCNKGSKDTHQKIKLKNKDGRKAFYVHRLVAEAYIPNPENLPEVNHKDHNPLNNSFSNLEWITHKDNCIDTANFKKLQKDIYANE